MFHQSLLAHAIRSACVLGMLAPLMAQADFVDDSQLKLDLRNLYLHRNFTEGGAPVSRVGNWSQGFDLQFTSGYTDTPIQFGLDLNAQFAYVMDSEGSDGSLPLDSDGEAVDDYGRAGATLKMKYSKTELKVGDMRPQLPIAFNDPSRQLDTVYQGAVVESREIDGLTLTGGRFWSAVTRDSSDHEKFYLFGSSDDLDSDGLDFAGATYDFTRSLQASYFYAVMNDIYRQQYLGLVHRADLGNGYGLRTDVRWFDNQEQGDALNGAIDNRALSSGVALTKGGHKVSLVYQRMYGESMFPTPNGYIPQFYLLNWANQPFMRPKERSVGIGYAYDFAALGMPGLTVNIRYIDGSDIDLGATSGSESERNSSVRYVLQDGVFKGLGFEWRNYHVQQHGFGSDFVENRFITSYTWNLW